MTQLCNVVTTSRIFVKELFVIFMTQICNIVTTDADLQFQINRIFMTKLCNANIGDDFMTQICNVVTTISLTIKTSTDIYDPTM